MFIPWKYVNYLLYWTPHLIVGTHLSSHSLFNSEKFTPKQTTFSFPNIFPDFPLKYFCY